MNRKARTTVSTILLAGGSLALLFLIYSLVEIYMFDMILPQARIIVEAMLFVVLFGMGLYLRNERQDS